MDFTIKRLTRAQRIEYYRWYCFFNEKFPGLLASTVIMSAECDGVRGAGIMVHAIKSSNLCMFSFITRNPFCDKTLSSEAVDHLIKNLGSIAKTLGYATFISTVGEEPAKARYRKNGIKESKGTLSLFWGEC